MRQSLKVLWVAIDLLHPQDRGGRIRTFHVAGHLNEDWTQIYCGLVRSNKSEALANASAYSKQMYAVDHSDSFDFRKKLGIFLSSLIARRPFSVWSFKNSDLQNQIKTAIEKHRPDLVVCDFVHSFENMPKGLKVPFVLFQHNAEASLWQRRYLAEKAFLKKMAFWVQWKTMFRYERHVVKSSSAVVCVSPEDAKIFQDDYKATNCHVIETSVDTERLKYLWNPQQDSKYVLFVGSLDWEPNHQGISWFLERVWPLIRQDQPGLGFKIVGKNPGSALQRLINAAPGVELVGRVPSVEPYLHGAQLSIVPLLTGGGTRMKIFESFAAGTPLVSTSLGAEGLKVVHGKHAMIADSPEDFAASVSGLCRDASKALEISRAARELVVSQNSASAIAQEFKGICERIVPEFAETFGVS